MVSSAVRSLTPWLQADTAPLLGSTAATLGNTVCRTVPLAIERSTLGHVPAIAAAVKQLVAQSLRLRSPLGGWPTDLPQTPESLAPYLGEETGELLDLLASAPPAPPVTSTLIPVPSLLPHLLWMLASSGYEIMRLIEGVQARVFSPQTQGGIHIVRLVPVLMLTLEETSYALDLVTQTDPLPPLYVDEDTEIRLLENDLDSQPLTCGDLLAQTAEQIGYTQPGLSRLLGNGCKIDALRPFQPWQTGTLTLHLHLAKMGIQGPPQPHGSPSEAIPDARYLPPGGQPSHGSDSGFTLDDFASTLVDGPDSVTAGVLGDWLTFTDERWIQTFLSAYAEQVVAQHLPQMLPGHEGDREDRCNRVAYAATNLVQGASGLFKHTFVHEPILVADVWPRLRWHLAQSSERVMQLMGGVSAQVLPPGLSWQQGSLYLRPLMQLTTSNRSWPDRSWIVDLSRGRLLPTNPQALPAEAAVDVADDPWGPLLTVADLTALADRDLSRHSPAIAALRQGTPIHLHRLDAEVGCQVGQLTLDWCFTLQTTL